ncbi:MAG: EAL domain-containing protein, partial [Ottowia sp.]|nr:EAL domain-containing protein [Ottowia sp.]
ADVRAALQAGDQFSVHYQPLFNQQRCVTGVEALLRWRHPARGAVSPAEFIPIVEDTGLILPLGHWVLEQACAQLAAWAERPETAQLSIAVNVSVRQFRHPEFVDHVIAAIRRHRVPPRLLKLELTESLLADRMEITLEKMDTLKQLGVTLSLDDFGTGYSSLAYLKRLPLDQLKIDKGFVADVLTDPSDAAIARAIIELAHSQGLSVIAEGVETEEQHRFLVDHGCDLFQGFLLAKPMSIGALEEFMDQHRATATAPLHE